MNSSQSFPPADALLMQIRRIDYIKHLNFFMNSVENLCIIIAAIAIIIGQRWREHRCSDRLRSYGAIGTALAAVAAAIIRETVWPAAILWVRETARPAARQWASVSAMLCRGILTPPLTV